MLNNRFNDLDHLNAGDRIEVLMKKDKDLPDLIGLFQKLHVIEDESVRMEFLVLDEEPDTEDQEQVSTWYISLKAVEQIRKLQFH